MKNIINKIVFGSLTLALSSCIGNYEHINSNPYEALICQRMDML